MKRIVTTRTLLAFTFLAVLILAACTPDETPPADSGTDSEEPVVSDTIEDVPPPAPDVDPGLQDAVSSSLLLDPANSDEEFINGLIYEGLIRSGNSGGTLPGLAVTWTISEDKLDYIFTLRTDAAFHDGTPLTADVVIDNFNRWFDGDHPLRGNGSFAGWEAVFSGFKGETQSDGTAKSSFDGIEKVDNLTVLIHLSRQDSSLLSNLATLPLAIVSADALAAAGDSYGEAGSTIAGTGPYMVTDFSSDTLVLSPNPDFRGEVPSDDLEFPLQ